MNCSRTSPSPPKNVHGQETRKCSPPCQEKVGSANFTDIPKSTPNFKLGWWICHTRFLQIYILIQKNIPPICTQLKLHSVWNSWSLGWGPCLGTPPLVHSRPDTHGWWRSILKMIQWLTGSQCKASMTGWSHGPVSVTRWAAWWWATCRHLSRYPGMSSSRALQWSKLETTGALTSLWHPAFEMYRLWWMQCGGGGSCTSCRQR